jgi:serine/threonine protein kinase
MQNDPIDFAEALGEQYEFKEVLGRGAFATVVRAIERKSLNECAVKVS